MDDSAPHSATLVGRGERRQMIDRQIQKLEATLHKAGNMSQQLLQSCSQHPASSSSSLSTQLIPVSAPCYDMPSLLANRCDPEVGEVYQLIRVLDDPLSLKKRSFLAEGVVIEELSWLHKITENGHHSRESIPLIAGMHGSGSKEEEFPTSAEPMPGSSPKLFIDVLPLDYNLLEASATSPSSSSPSPVDDLPTPTSPQSQAPSASHSPPSHPSTPAKANSSPMLFSKSSHVWACTACLTVFESLALCEVHITQVKCSGAVVQLQTIAYPCSCSFETDTPDEWYDHRASCHGSSSEPGFAEVSGLGRSAKVSDRRIVSASTSRPTRLGVPDGLSSNTGPNEAAAYLNSLPSETPRHSVDALIHLGSQGEDDLAHNTVTEASLSPSPSSLANVWQNHNHNDHSTAGSSIIIRTDEASRSRLPSSPSLTLTEPTIVPINVLSSDSSENDVLPLPTLGSAKRKRGRPSTHPQPSKPSSSKRAPVTYARSSMKRARNSASLKAARLSQPPQLTKASTRKSNARDDDADYELSDHVPLSAQYKPSSSVSQSKRVKGKGKAVQSAQSESESEMDLDAARGAPIVRASAKGKGKEGEIGSQPWESQQIWSDTGRPLRTAASSARENAKMQLQGSNLVGLFDPTAAHAFAPLPGPRPRRSLINNGQVASGDPPKPRPIPTRGITDVDKPAFSSRPRRSRALAWTSKREDYSDASYQSEEEDEDEQPRPKRRKANRRPSEKTSAKYATDPEADGAGGTRSAANLGDNLPPPSKCRAKDDIGEKQIKPPREPHDIMEIPLHGWALQTARCIRLRKYQVPQCVHCIRRQSGDSCRFRRVRELFFKDAMATGETRLISNQDNRVPVEFPTTFNVEPQRDHLQRVQYPIAEHMLPVLKQELEHIARPNVILRSLELGFRLTCDICKTSMFSCSWLCVTCGREACPECFQTIDDVPEEERVPNVRGQRNSAVFINHHYCVMASAHYGSNFVPISRFSRDELGRAVAQMERLLECRTPDGSFSQEDECIAFDINTHHHEMEVDDIAGVPTRVLHAFEGPDIEQSIFRRVWKLGEPFVVTGMLEKFKIQWTPPYFIDKYGSSGCMIVDCTSESIQNSTVEAFFKHFGNTRSEDEILKLKDWPSTTEFREEFPELFQDFSETVPVPDYTRRDGIMNIASHFPLGTVVPDIGPKMYNAFEASEEPGGFGSTRLHMDMADAVNIMTYASKRKNGDPGFAAWNIYHANDAQAIREFLREKFPEIEDSDDPIHSQRYFLDTSLRKELWEQKQVKSWRIEQKPGEAVFIPAGCAHQVSNSADCIKVAVDFVSPENIRRCSQLTNEFRSLNLAKAWKEDVLQLRTMLWYAWQSCEQLESSLSDDPVMVQQPETFQAGDNDGT